MQDPIGNHPPHALRPIIERPRLLRRLDATCTRIVLFCAPAGYGKTTLARQWLAGRRHIWCTTSESSTDPAVLVASLCQALSAAGSEHARTLRKHIAVAVTAGDTAHHLADATLSAFESWPEDTILALDDFHVVEPASESGRILTHLVTESQVPLLVLSRRRPMWSSAKSRVYGGLAELNQHDLAMTPSEAKRLLSGKPPTAIGSIVSACDGWPAALSLAWSTNSRAFTPRRSPLSRDLYTFIADEVFTVLAEDTRDCLPALALACPLSAKALTRILGMSRATRLRHDLMRCGILLSEEDDLNLHPLFRTFLAQHLEGRTSSLRRSIVHSLVQDRRWDEAFSVASTPDDFSLIDDVVCNSLRPMLKDGRVATLARWHDSSTRNTRTRCLRVLAAELARRDGRYADAEAHAVQALNEFGDCHPLASFALCVAGSAAHLSHDDALALRHFQRAHDLSVDLRDREESVWGLLLASAALEDSAALDRVERQLDKTLHPASATAQLRRATAQYVIGRVRGTFRPALTFAASIRPLAHDSEDPRITSVYLHSLAYMQAFDARYAEALSTASDALAHANEYRLHFARPHIRATEALALAGCGRAADAQAIIDELLHGHHDQRARQFIEINCSLILARLALASGDIDSAVSLTSHDYIEPPEKAIFSELLGMRALSQAISGDLDAARNSIVRARTISHSAEGACFALAAEAVILSRLPGATSTSLQAKADQVSHRSGRDSLLTAMKGFDPLRIFLSPQSDLHGSCPVLSSPSSLQKHMPDESLKTAFRLTQREREVAELLVSGRSNREIARELVIAESTAKLHIRRVLRKVDAKSRTEAVVKLLKRGY